MTKSTIVIIVFMFIILLLTTFASIDSWKRNQAVKAQIKTEVKYDEVQALSKLVSNLDKLEKDTSLYIIIKLNKTFNDRYTVDINYGDKQYERDFASLSAMLAYLSDSEANFSYIVNAKEFE